MLACGLSAKYAVGLSIFIRFGIPLYMTRAATHTNFHRSSLIQVLTELTLVATGDSDAAFADNLSVWLSLDDDISLCAVLGISPSVVSPRVNVAASVCH